MQRTAMPALIYATDAEAHAYFRGRGIKTVNGTDNLNDWRRTRLRRHIQRTEGEKFLAAAALASSGLNVLLTDSSHVALKNAVSFFRSQSPAADVLVQRGNCMGGKARRVRCPCPRNPPCGLRFRAGAPPHSCTRTLTVSSPPPFSVRESAAHSSGTSCTSTERRSVAPSLQRWCQRATRTRTRAHARTNARTQAFTLNSGALSPAPCLSRQWVESAIRKGMVNFYLRWWAGHHCVTTGFDGVLDRPGKTT